eukprot:gene9623-biopygen3426
MASQGPQFSVGNAKQRLYSDGDHCTVLPILSTLAGSSFPAEESAGNPGVAGSCRELPGTRWRISHEWEQRSPRKHVRNPMGKNRKGQEDAVVE